MKEVVDLTGSPANKDSGNSKTKKLKQMRLPFAPIQKDLQAKENKVKAVSKEQEKPVKPTSLDTKSKERGSFNKRKRSEDMGNAPSKVIVLDEGATADKSEHNSYKGGSSVPKENKAQEQDRGTPKRIQPTFLGKSPASVSASRPSSSKAEAATGDVAKKQDKQEPKAKKQLGLPSPDKPAVVETTAIIKK